eukprot:1840728-Alexandrium_andersonii.AAC.1
MTRVRVVQTAADQLQWSGQSEGRLRRAGAAPLRGPAAKPERAMRSHREPPANALRCFPMQPRRPPAPRP